jgi:hypothetical protein
MIVQYRRLLEKKDQERTSTYYLIFNILRKQIRGRKLKDARKKHLVTYKANPSGKPKIYQQKH